MFIHPLVLITLPDREMRAGFAEVLKYGLLGDAAFFDWLEVNGSAVLAHDPGARAHAYRNQYQGKGADCRRG